MSSSAKYAYDFDPSGDSAAARVCRRVVETASAGGTVLELGTGPGSISRVLSEQYDVRIVGVEIDPEAAKRAERYCQEIFVGDLEREVLSGLEGRRFRVIVAADVLEHLKDPGTVLKRLANHIEPGGRLIISVPHIGYCGLMAALACGEFPYATKGLLDETHLRFYTPRSFSRLLELSGWRVESDEHFIIGPLDTEYAHYWTRLPAEEQQILMQLPHAMTYQWVMTVVRRSENQAVEPYARELSPPHFGDMIRSTARRLDQEIIAHQETRDHRYREHREFLETLEGERQAHASALAAAELLRHEQEVVLRREWKQLEDRRREEQQSYEASLDWKSQELAKVYASRSWKITAPLRDFNAAIGVAFHAGAKVWRQAGSAKFLVKKTWSYYKKWGWRQTFQRIATELRRRKPAPRASSRLPLMVDWEQITPLFQEQPGSIALHAHLYYSDIAHDLAGYLRDFPFSLDLFISVRDEAGERECQDALANLACIGQLKVVISPNRGRDFAPMLALFGNELLKYDFFGHIHSKKSLHSEGIGNGWRRYLYDSLLGGMKVRRIFGLFHQDPGVGLVYPQNFSWLPLWANTWLANKGLVSSVASRIGALVPKTAYFDFPAGSMFWARTSALASLLKAGYQFDDFPAEGGQTDGTLAHCLERLLPGVVEQAGFKSRIMADNGTPNWSPWRVDNYFAVTSESVRRMLDAPNIKLVIFDIFDTLLTRPLLDAESTKAIVAARAGIHGPDYLRLRPLAEQAARERLKHDVNLEQIAEQFVLEGWFDQATAHALMAEEIRVEAASVQPRADVVGVFREAIALGHRVILASDMFLPHDVLEHMLRHHGIHGYHRFYLSNVENARKDSGQLYRLILEQEGVSPADVVMFGDNERSDIQIPTDLGMRVVQIMRSVDQAWALPRWRPLIEQSQSNLDDALTLGLLVRRFFGSAFHGDNPPCAEDFVLEGGEGIGYAVLGPLLTSFCQWLVHQAREDGIKHLHFLSREGQIIYNVFTQLSESERCGIEASYLVLSRRTVTVAALDSEEAVLALAAGRYFPNTLENFLFYRYGLVLDADDLKALVTQGVWKEGQLVEVDGCADHLRTVLSILTPKILEHARDEKKGLMVYLASVGLPSPQSAVVDVGYAGTIQDYLSRLLVQPVHGYYMMSSHKALAVRDRHQAILRALFGEWLDEANHDCAYWKHSFTLEQLLSSDDPQVIRYEYGAEGVSPVFHQLSEAEQATHVIRAALRTGVMAFAREARQLRGELLPQHVVSARAAEGVFSSFIEGLSSRERQVLDQMYLDDHYCGRGVVAPVLA